MDRSRGRRRDAEGKIQSNRPERSPSLQQRHEEARLLRRADPRRLRPLSYLEIAGREGRYELGGASEDLESLFQLLQESARQSAQEWRAPGIWARFPGDGQRRRPGQPVQ